MSFVKPCRALWLREILRFVRQPSRMIGALATPLLFWLLIGSGFGKSFQDQESGQNYFEFFFPGALTMSVLFTAIFSTMSVIEDRHQGFLQGVLVSPASRASIVGGKVLGGATLALFQGLLLLLVSPFAGVELTLAKFVIIGLLLFAMAICMTGLGFMFAWKIDSVQGYHGIMNIVLMPMWMLSGSLFPISKTGGVFEWLGKINPLTYGVGALRDVMWNATSSEVFWNSVKSLGILFLMGAFFSFASWTIMKGKNQKYVD